MLKKKTVRIEIALTDEEAVPFRKLAKKLDLTLEQVFQRAVDFYVERENVRAAARRALERQDETFTRLAAEETLERVAQDEAKATAEQSGSEDSE